MSEYDLPGDPRLAPGTDDGDIEDHFGGAEPEEDEGGEDE